MLYNVTFDIGDASTRLIPYIPYSAADDEDRKTKRVCFADSIQHCIEAIGSCNRDLHTGCLIVVRSVDEKGLDPGKIITPGELFDTKKVPDALETHEYWYLDEVDVKREVYRVKGFTFEYAIAFTCIEKDDLAAIIKNYIPDSPMKQYESVKQAYDRALEQLYEAGRYNDCDKFEDRVAALPWAQRIKISSLAVEKLPGCPGT